MKKSEWRLIITWVFIMAAFLYGSAYQIPSKFLFVWTKNRFTKNKWLSRLYARHNHWAMDQDIKWMFDSTVTIQRKNQLLQKAQNYISANSSLMNTRNLVTFMTKCAKNNILIESELTQIALAFRRQTSGFYARGFGMTLYSLRNINDTVKVHTLFEVLAEKLENCNDEFVEQDISNALFGLQRMNNDTKDVRSLLRALAKKITSCNDAFTAQGIGNSLYGLKGMSSDIREVREILKALTKCVESCSQAFTPQEVSNSLYGLQGMSSESPEVRTLVGALVSKIETCATPLSPQGVGNSLFGLKRMRSDDQEVQALLKVLLLKISSSKGKLSAQEISNALFGLQGMSSHVAVVSATLMVLTSKLEQCTAPFNQQDISNAIFGLQGMSSDVAEVQGVLRALLSKVDSCKDSLSPQGVGNALFGLRSCSDTDADVKEMLGSLVRIVTTCKKPLGAQDVSMALFGLQRMSMTDGTVSSLLFYLQGELVVLVPFLSLQGIGMILYGLQNIYLDNSWRDIVVQMLKHAVHLLASRDSAHTELLPLSEVQSALQYVSLLSGCELPLTHKLVEWGLLDATIAVRNLCQRKFNLQMPLSSPLAESDGDQHYRVETAMESTEKRNQMHETGAAKKKARAGSYTEKRYRLLVAKAMQRLRLQSSRTRLESNIWLHGFEADLVLYSLAGEWDARPAGESEVVINIEIDGPHHKQQATTLFCGLRDEYLSLRHGIKVVRLDVMHLDRISAEAALEDVTARLASLLPCHSEAEVTLLL